MGTIWCPACGKPAASGHRFCWQCGTQLPVGTGPGAPPSADSPADGDPVAESAAAAMAPAEPAPEPAGEPGGPAPLPTRLSGARWGPRRRWWRLAAWSLAILLPVAGGLGAWQWWSTRPSLGDVILMTTPGTEPGTGLPGDEFLASYPIYVDVLVNRGRVGHQISVQLLQAEPEPLAEDTVTLTAGGTKYVGLELLPEAPLTPGRYQVEVALNGAVAVRRDVMVEPDLPFHLKQITLSISAPGVEPGGGPTVLPSSASKIFVSALVDNAPHRAMLKVTWMRDTLVLQTDEVELTGKAEQTVSSALSSRPLTPPGTYTLRFLLNDKNIATKTFRVFSTPIVGDMRILSYEREYEEEYPDSDILPAGTDTVTLYTDVVSAPKGTRLTVEWYHGGQKLFDDEYTATEHIVDRAWYPAIWDYDNGLSGAYTAVFRIDGQERQRVTFRVEGSR